MPGDPFICCQKKRGKKRRQTFLAEEGRNHQTFISKTVDPKTITVPVPFRFVDPGEAYFAYLTTLP